jgi:hypothetical protein
VQRAHAIFRRTRYSTARKPVRLIFAVGEEPVSERSTPVILDEYSDKPNRM